MIVNLSWDVALLIEHRIGTLLTQVRFTGAASDFSPRIHFQCRLSRGVRTPPCAIACTYIYAHGKDPCQSSVDYGNSKTASMHRRFGSATLSQLAFPGESDLNFQWEYSQIGQYSCGKKMSRDDPARFSPPCVMARIHDQTLSYDSETIQTVAMGADRL